MWTEESHKLYPNDSSLSMTIAFHGNKIFSKFNIRNWREHLTLKAYNSFTPHLNTETYFFNEPRIMRKKKEKVLFLITFTYQIDTECNIRNEINNCNVIHHIE